LREMSTNTGQYALARCSCPGRRQGTSRVMERGEPQVLRFRGLDGDRAAMFAGALTAALLGALGLSGWMVESGFLREPLIRIAAVNPATAVALLLGACSIALSGADRPRLAIAAAVLMAGIAAAKLADIIFG